MLDENIEFKGAQALATYELIAMYFESIFNDNTCYYTGDQHGH